MKLEQMKTNFLDMSDKERQEFFTKYSEKRTKDVQEVVVKLTPKKRSKKKADKKVSVSQEQLELLKKLGLV